MKLRKIKDMNLCGRTWTGKPQSEESINKRRIKIHGRTTSLETLFKKGNKFGEKTRGMKKTEQQKIAQSLRRIGQPSNRSKEENIKQSNRLKENNPMKNPETAKKQHNHPNVKKSSSFKARTILADYQFKTNVLITDKLKKDIILDYLDGISLTKLGQKYHLDRHYTIRKMIIEMGIEIRPDYSYLNKSIKEVQNENNLLVNNPPV